MAHADGPPFTQKATPSAAPFGQADASLLTGDGYLFDGRPELDDTWAYDYETNTWTEMSPEASPPQRYEHAMAYDAESENARLAGSAPASC